MTEFHIFDHQLSWWSKMWNSEFWIITLLYYFIIDNITKITSVCVCVCVCVCVYVCARIHNHETAKTTLHSKIFIRRIYLKFWENKVIIVIITIKRNLTYTIQLESSLYIIWGMFKRLKLFTKREMNNEWNVNFLQNSPLGTNCTSSSKFSVNDYLNDNYVTCVFTQFIQIHNITNYLMLISILHFFPK